MTTFDNREQGFETAHARTEENDFRIEARGSKLFGLWIAEQFGLEGPDAETYAGEVVAANLEEPGFDDILRKVQSDLDEKGIVIDQETLNAEIDKSMAEAARQIKAGE